MKTVMALIGAGYAQHQAKPHLELYGVCAADDRTDRILTEYYETSENMTIEMCLSICRSKGYPFSGLEWSCECHCGYEPENGFEWAWSSKCDDRCAGDSNQNCGGSSALSVWTTPPQNPSGLCINDYPENQRVLNAYSITGVENMTIEYCHSFCQDFAYFGVQNGDSCFCGNDDSKFIPVPNEECYYPCAGDRTQMCGALWRLNVYDRDSIHFSEEKDVLMLTARYEDVWGTNFNSKLLSFDGEIHTSVLTYENGATADLACSFNFENQLWVAGGFRNKRQLSKLQECTLEYVMDLPFEMRRGSCNVFLSNNVERAWLCFTEDSPSSCQSYDGVGFAIEMDTHYGHVYSNLASYHGAPFVTGGSYTVKTEIFDTTARNWQIVEDFSYALNTISWYASISTDNAVFIIGGYLDSGPSSKIVRYQNGWSHINDLFFARTSLEAIKFKDQVMVVGGSDYSGYGYNYPVYTEIWDAEFSSGFQVKNYHLQNNGYSWQMSLSLVDPDFCIPN